MLKTGIAGTDPQKSRKPSHEGDDFMPSHSHPSIGCACCCNRRHFLAKGCGLCGGAIAGGLLGRPVLAASEQTPARPRVRLVFACWAVKQDRPTWPHIGYDFAGEIQRVTSELGRLVPQVEFLHAVAHSPEDAKKLLAADTADRIDGYLVYHMNNWIQVMQPIIASGKPVLVGDFSFAGSGGFNLYTAALRRSQRNFSVVASTKLEDLIESARCFELLKKGSTPADFVAACDRTRRERTPSAAATACQDDTLKIGSIGGCLGAMKRSKLLIVGGQLGSLAGQIHDRLGIEVQEVGFKEFAAAYDRTDRDQARELAARWRATARGIDIPEAETTLEKSARQALAQRAFLKERQAEGISINCLGGFYGGHLTAYPCLGFVELLDAGLVGACEADALSSVTMIALKHLVGRPGFISDPVLDTSKRQIVYAHCVAPTKMLGPASQSNPFEILTHSEDRRGAAVRSFLPLGYMTSTLKIHPTRQEILFHQAKAVENVVNDRACRTKLAGEVVGDMEKLFTFWDQYSWHRVTVYGDLREPIKELAAALKFKFVEEA